MATGTRATGWAVDMRHQRYPAIMIASLWLSASPGVMADGGVSGASLDAGEDAAAGARVDGSLAGGSESLFSLDASQVDPIRFTRLSRDFDEPLPGPVQAPLRGTEFSFSLAPGRFDFSRQGGYGLGSLFNDPEVAVDRVPSNRHRRHADDVKLDLTTGLNDGFRYSAGIRIEHEDADIDGTPYVSSSLLGLSYGRLGRLWYGGIDVNLEQFVDDPDGTEQPDVLSLDVTTGRRLGITGLGADSPLWLLSLHGDFDLLDAGAEESVENEADWYLNPSLFWRHPGFTFSAQMQLPVESALSSTDDEEEPDYRLRAIFEKRFK